MIGQIIGATLHLRGITRKMAATVIGGSVNEVNSYVDGKDIPRRQMVLLREMCGLDNRMRFTPSRVHFFALNTQKDNGLLSTISKSIGVCLVARIKFTWPASLRSLFLRHRFYALQNEHGVRYILRAKKNLLFGDVFSIDSLEGAEWGGGSRETAIVEVKSDIYKTIINNELTCKGFDDLFLGNHPEWSEVIKMVESLGLTTSDVVRMIKEGVRVRHDQQIQDQIRVANQVHKCVSMNEKSVCNELIKNKVRLVAKQDNLATDLNLGEISSDINKILYGKVTSSI